MDTDDPQIRRWLEVIRQSQQMPRPNFRYCQDEDYSTSGRAEQQGQLPEGMAEVHQFKLTLEGSKPPIWRRLVLPAGIHLDAPHSVIQIAMGWDNKHLHLFMVGNHKFGAFIFFGDPDTMNNEDCLDEAEARLDAILVQPKDKIRSQSSRLQIMQPEIWY